jgi:hypothetical protein
VPDVNGTTKVIGRDGQVCDVCATAANVCSDIATAIVTAANTPKRLK